MPFFSYVYQYKIKKQKLDQKSERFLFCHLCAAILTMFIGIPVFILASVSLLTLLVTLPVTLIF